MNQIKCIKLYSETDKDDTPCVLVATTKGTLFRFKITDDIEEFKTGQVLHQDAEQQLISDFDLTKSEAYRNDDGQKILYAGLVVGNGAIKIIKITCRGE